MTWHGLRRFGKACLLIFLLLLLAFSTLLWYLTTDSFQRFARRRLIAEMERATGGRVELGRFHVVPLRLQVEVRDLTIHGRESAGDQPFAHVDSMAAVISLSAALGARLAFHSLTLEHPVLHIIFYPDGSTNQPAPAGQSTSDFARIFSLYARRLEVRQGELVVQDQHIPLNFLSNDISTDLSYSFLHFRYSGKMTIGRAETRLNNMRPVAWSAQATFNLDRNGIQIQQLTAASENSRLLAKGVHVDLGRVAVNGNYDLNLDLAQAAAVTRSPELKAGTLHLVGSGSWSPQTFSATGDLGLHGLALDSKAIAVRDLSANGKFSLDPRSVSLRQVDGQFLHGAYTADAEITNWQTPLKSAKNQEQQGVLRIKTKNLSVPELLESLGPGFRPVNRLKFAGNATTTAEVQWKRSISDAEANVIAEISPPAKLQNGQIPLTASARGAYNFRTGDLKLTDLSATTSATQILASGRSSSGVKLSFSSTNLSEWQPVITQLFPSGAPLIVNGRATFNGTAAGNLPGWRLAGNLQLQDFATIIPASHSRPQQFHWDSLTTDVQASSTNLVLRNGLARRDDMTLKMNGAAGLENWNLTPGSALRFHVNVQNANADQISALAGYDHELSGQLSADFQLSGTRQQPQGQGQFSIVNAAIHGQAFDSVSAALSLSGGKLSARNLQISSGDARITGNGDYDFKSNKLDLSAHGTNFELADLTPFERSQVDVAGKLDFNAQIVGSPERPQVTADLHLHNLTLNNQLEGDFLLNAVSHGADATITGHSDFKDAQLQVDGNVRLRDQWPTHINFHFSHLNADPFLESYAHSRQIRNSLVAGEIVLDGPLRNTQGLKLSGNLSDFYADVGRISFRNDGPILFGLLDRVFTIDQLHIVGENTDLAASGSVQLAGARALNLQGTGKIDLKLIQSYDRDITSSGSLTGDGHLTGTLDAPLLQGKLQIEHGAISDINVPSALSEINGTLLFSQNQVSIQSLNAHVGGGNVAFTGHAELAGRQLNFDLNANADSVRLRYPPGVSSTANAALRWNGSSIGSLLSGDITLTKLGFTPGFDFGAYLERASAVSSLPQTDPVLNTIRLDLHFTTTPELQMQTSVIRLQGAADLHVRGSAAKPVLLGRADVFEGQAYFNGTKYRLERGGVTFSNPAVTTPFLDLEAITRVRDYDVTLSLSGDVSKPNGLKVNYRSDPPLPTADIIALLAFGQTTQESAQLQQTNQSGFSQQASNAMLAAALNATLNNRAQRLFGNSRIKIDPQGLESETSTITQTGPAVTIEQQVQDNLTLSYTTDVSQTSQQVIRGEYNISRNVSIIAIRDQNGVVSFDITIRRRKR